MVPQNKKPPSLPKCSNRISDEHCAMLRQGAPGESAQPKHKAWERIYIHIYSTRQGNTRQIYSTRLYTYSTRQGSVSIYIYIYKIRSEPFCFGVTSLISDNNQGGPYRKPHNKYIFFCFASYGNLSSLPSALATLEIKCYLKLTGSQTIGLFNCTDYF